MQSAKLFALSVVTSFTLLLANGADAQSFTIRHGLHSGDACGGAFDIDHPLIFNGSGTFEIETDRYEAFIDSSALVNNRTACSVALDIAAPSGYAVNVERIDWTGHADMNAAIPATLRVIAYRQGQSTQAVSERQIVGLGDRDFSLSGLLSPASLNCNDPRKLIVTISATTDFTRASQGTNLVELNRPKLLLRAVPCR